MAELLRVEAAKKETAADFADQIKAIRKKIVKLSAEVESRNDVRAG